MRWIFRRRHGVTKDAAPAPWLATSATAAERQSAAPSPAGQPTARQAPPGHPAGDPAPGPRDVSWFRPDPGRPYENLPYGVDEYGRRPGHVAVLSPAPSSAPPRPPAAPPPAADPPSVIMTPAAAPSVPLRPPPAAPATAADVAPPAPEPEMPAPVRSDVPWPDICDQFGLHLLVLAEQLRTSLDELEADEGDPERLRRLYQVDHAVTRMRRASRDLRTLAGRSEEELAGFTTSLLDVIRMAASAIERYTQVKIGKVSDLAVLGYAADDIGSVMAALLDNATRYSPGTVTVSCHLLEDGGVMYRIEDTGIGLGAEQVSALNELFAGPVPDVDDRTGRHTGFPVVHRIARKHLLRVRLANRPAPSSGTVAMVTLPPHLLCEAPTEEAQRRPAPAPQQAPPRPSAVPDLPRGELSGPDLAEGAEEDQDRDTANLPRRAPASLRGNEPRPEKQQPGMVPSAEQQAAARRSFADDLSAFSLGATGPADGLTDDAATPATEETEEEAQP